MFITECDEGFYGTYCNQTCGNCFQTTCDKTTGRCPDGCDAGWNGNLCIDGEPKENETFYVRKPYSKKFRLTSKNKIGQF